MVTSSTHDLSVDSVEVFEDSFASTANFRTARPSREQFTVNQKSSLWLRHVKYSMKVPPLVSIKEFKEALSKKILQHVDAFFLACSESSLYIPRHSNQFKQCVC